MSINNRAKQAIQNRDISIADNSTSVVQTYRDRIRFQETHKRKNNALNIATDKELYGRLDTEQNTVYPKFDKMTQLFSRGKSTSVFVLPFVNDAFVEMEKNIVQSIRAGRIKQSELFPFTIEPTYRNFNTEYDRYFTQILINYESYLNNFNYIDKVVTFKDYMNYFINYVKSVNVPLTATSYLLLLNINTSGLCFQIKNKDFSSDIHKEQFYKLEQFNLYDNTLKKYGFSYDVNAPWRIIFNVNSTLSKTYMSKYNIKKEKDIFDLYYNKTYDTELSMMFKGFIDHYNNICKKYNLVFESENYGYTVVTTTRRRQVADLETEYENIGELKLLKLYFYFRLKEENYELNQQEFEQLLTKMSLIYVSSGKNEANKFIVENTKTLPAGGRNPPLSLTRGIRSDKNTLNVVFKL